MKYYATGLHLAVVIINLSSIQITGQMEIGQRKKSPTDY